MEKVIISNGHNKFILGPIASSLQKVSKLDAYISTAYPTIFLLKVIYFLKIQNISIVHRFIARQELIYDELVYSSWVSEIIFRFGSLLKKFKYLKKIGEIFDVIAMEIYSIKAVKALKLKNSKIYHFRSGFGQYSLRYAKSKNVLCICDHSIAHPFTIDYLINNGGKLPDPGTKLNISPMWRAVLRDIDQSDAVIVNSNFVKSTFLNQGWDENRIHVAYTGVDNEFLNAIPERSFKLANDENIKFVFAGEFGSRKGAEVLIKAFNSINNLDWTLEIIGSIDSKIRNEFPYFFQDKRVKLLGVIPRTDLAQKFTKSDVFVFPSLAEGSARVVFMAMACGCYIITTPNSGSIVEDKIHGDIINAGDALSLENAIRNLYKINMDKINLVGLANAKLIRENYTEDTYFKQVFSIYSKYSNL
jgi:glycosyltransferase involved in cell wall biosynthesis